MRFGRNAQGVYILIVDSTDNATDVANKVALNKSPGLTCEMLLSNGGRQFDIRRELERDFALFIHDGSKMFYKSRGILGEDKVTEITTGKMYVSMIEELL